MDSTTGKRRGGRVASDSISPRPTADPALIAVLTRLREQRGWSREQLAHEAGLTASAYHRIENGKSAPGWLTVRRLAEALGVSLRDLGAMVEAEQ